MLQLPCRERKEFFMWQLYDELIAAVPADIQIGECIIGMHWTLIRSRAMGMALTPFGAGRAYGKQGGSIIAGIGNRIAGMSVRKLAEYVKSWNPYEAALGLAAEGMTIIMASHFPDHALLVANLVAILNKGQIRQIGGGG
jgi:hypothetical protein